MNSLSTSLYAFKWLPYQLTLIWFLTGVIGLSWPVGASASDSNKIVLVAVDLSSSTKTHREDYKKYFRMILDAMGERDVLLVTKIMKQPSASESLAFPAIEYEEATLLKNRRQIKEMNLKKSLVAMKQFEMLVNDRADDETPIIEVTQSSQRLFQQFKADRQIIVYLSDMMEYSKTTSNFESTKPIFSKTLAESAWAKIKKEGRVASLKGAKIYVAGARDANPMRMEAVKWFWANYFRDAGASLDVNNYGSDLVVFKECNSTGSCGTVFQDQRDKRLAK
jgi:hypothetical protein